MTESRAILTVTAGPNAGDTVRLDLGSCRLVGRHLSENETAFIDRDGNRLLDGRATNILEEHLKDKAPEAEQPANDSAAIEALAVDAFERGPDIILADDSISRAHAMVFYDNSGAGIIDLASTNGTYVNRDRIGSAMLKDGDVLGVGSSELEVRLQ